MRLSQLTNNSGQAGIARPSVALKEQVLNKIKQLQSKKPQAKFQELFISAKNPTSLVQTFMSQYHQEIEALQNPEAHQQFRERFFKDTLLPNLSAKQYKRRKNSFYILTALIDKDPHFAPVALKQFHKIKDILFSQQNLPDLTNLEVTADYLKFKVFINTQVHEWTEKYSGQFPDLFIWKKMQGQFFQDSIQQQGNNSISQQNFTDKYHQLRIYRVIYERNKTEVDELKHEFLKLRYECMEAKRLMLEIDEPKTKIENQPSFSKAEGIEYEEDEEEKVPNQDHKPQELNFLDDLLGQESTQIDAPQLPQQQILKIKIEDTGLDIEQYKKQVQVVDANAKNMTLMRVLNDNRKSLERRIIPLLEMFKVDTTYFKELQQVCMNVVYEKQETSSQLKINKKDLQEFREKYKAVQDSDLDKFSKTLENLLKQGLKLKQDLEQIRLKQEIKETKARLLGQYQDNDVQIIDEDEGILLGDQIYAEDEEDPDEQLFK